MDYDKLNKIIEDKNCKLQWSHEEFQKLYKNTSSPVNIISQCGHERIVPLANFIHKNTGVFCKSCLKENTRNKHVNNRTDYHMKEYTFIKALEHKCGVLFDFKILGECCLADVAIRPLTIKEDLWLPLQIKTIEKSVYNTYTFRIQNKYENMYVILYCINDNRLWIFNGNDINAQGIGIGKTKSKYDSNELSVDIVDKALLKKYNNSAHMLREIEILNTPLTTMACKELEFKKYRQSLLTSLHFSYPEVNGRVFDCIINKTYKIQDKLITCYTKPDRKVEGHKANLYRHRNSDGNFLYKKGDNDYYWFHLPDKKGAYIIPENAFLERNMISSDDNIEYVSMTLHFYPYRSLLVSKYTWLNDHLYFYDKDKDKILALFKNDPTRQEINLDDFTLSYKLTSKPKYDNKPEEHKEQTWSNRAVIQNNVTKDKGSETNKSKVEDAAQNKSDIDINVWAGLACIDCNKITADKRAKRCMDCYRLHSRKVERPPIEQLKEEFKTLTYVALGKKYGVSDNAIRKWLKNK